MCACFRPFVRSSTTTSPWQDCTVNNEPGVAIVMVDDVGEGKVAVMPRFVAIIPRMKIQFPEETESDSGGGGGPKTPREAFDANKATATRPAPR